MSTATDQSTSVRKSIDVAAEPQRAFHVFTAGFNRWWNRGHHLLPGELRQVTIEPGVGGRVFEESVAGEECIWGEVMSWDPPHSFAFSWRIGTDWAVPAPDAAHSLVTVTFTPSAVGTRVEVTHSGLDAHGEGWQYLRDSVGSGDGWPGLLRLYADAV